MNTFKKKNLPSLLIITSLPFYLIIIKMIAKIYSFLARFPWFNYLTWVLPIPSSEKEASTLAFTLFFGWLIFLYALYCLISIRQFRKSIKEIREKINI